jgi:hypothetical protein
MINEAELFENLLEAYRENGARITYKPWNQLMIPTLEIPNPFGGESITVESEFSTDLPRVTFRFSYQHAHFENFESDEYEALLTYIDDFIAGRQVAVEFFLNGEARFGGSRYLEDLDIPSGEVFFNRLIENGDTFFSHPLSLYHGRTYCCKLRAWNPSQDKDIPFTIP